MVDNIEWKPIIGYEGFYNISSIGDVFSIKNNRNISHCINSRGYVIVALNKGKNPTIKCLHQLLAIAFIPNPDNKPFVNHINGIKDDYSLNNLEWVTAKENRSHAEANGWIKKFTYKVYDNGVFIKEFATGVEVSEYFGVWSSEVYKIVNKDAFLKDRITITRTPYCKSATILPPIKYHRKHLNNLPEIDLILKSHKLDRRKKYVFYEGILCINQSVTQPCTGCSEHGEYEITPIQGSGCHECGYIGKRVNIYPVPILINNTFINEPSN